VKDKMTLIIALKYKKGIVLACDSRVMYGEIKRDQVRKVELLTESTGVAAAGLVGAIDDILAKVKVFTDSRPVSFDDMVSFLSDKSLEWFKKNEERLEEEDKENYAGFLMVSSDRIRKIMEKGYSEEVDDYMCEGSGVGQAYGEHILRDYYKENLEEKEAKELEIHIILETSKLDATVGEDIEMLVCSENKCEIIDKSEIEKLKARQMPLSKRATETQIKTIEDAVRLREEINNLWERQFGFKLFQPNERAILQIMKPCRSEDEFTNNILALALLTDQLNVKEMKKTISEKEGSITILKEFLEKNIGTFPSEIISNFRDIITLRSKNFPVHATDPKFIEVVIKLDGKYPPNLSNLYLKILGIYKESLNKLLDCLSSGNEHTIPP
jgi:20S proteasome alpha/beta subunit